MTSFAREEYVPFRPSLNTGFELSSQHSSHDSEESLRALELSDGPAPSISQSRLVGSRISKECKA